jgi:excinuclease ABC subunit A
MQTKTEDLMPWKINGERWHLSAKGFPPGKKVRWEQPLLPRFIKIVRDTEPTVQIVWEARDGILIKVPPIGRAWIRVKTKDPESLECRLVGKIGQFNLTHIEGIGHEPTLTSDRTDGQIITLRFIRDDHLADAKLRELLSAHLKGFQEAWGDGSSEDE